MVHFFLNFFDYLGFRDSSKPREEPLGHAVEGVDGRYLLVESRVARGGVEAHEVYHGRQVRCRYLRSETMLSSCLLVRRGPIPTARRRPVIPGASSYVAISHLRHTHTGEGEGEGA